MFKRKLYVLIISFLLIVLQTGCSDNDNDDFVSNNNELTGYFLDTIVEGLRYKCDSLEGQTGSDGSFNYFDGRTIEFFVGDIEIGSGLGQKIMTPVDLVDGATNEYNDHVVRICQFLLSCDTYNDGVISISEDIHNKAKNKTIDFSQNIENDVVQELFGQNNFVSYVDAKNHFAKTFKGKDILLVPMTLNLDKNDDGDKEVNVISETNFKEWTFSWDINNCPQDACACVGHEEVDEKEFQVYINSASNLTNCLITLNITLGDDTKVEKLLPVNIINTDNEQPLNFSTDYLNGKTFYNITEDNGVYEGSTYVFTDTEVIFWEGLSVVSEDQKYKRNYSIIEGGIVKFLFEGQEYWYIKLIDSNNKDFLSICFTDFLDDILNCSIGDELFFFDKSEALDYININRKKSGTLVESLSNDDSKYISRIN